MNRKREVLFVIAISALFMLRIIFLDSDVKNFQISQIPATIDEIYDNEIAVNIQQHGLYNLFTGVCGEVTSSNSKTLLMSNIVAGIFMSLLGNNFYGLRVGYVFIGWLTMLILLYCIRKCFSNSKIIQIGIVVLFLFDFNVLTLSRSAMTVIPCMFACLIYFAGYLKLKDRDKQLYFFIGIWPVVSLCLIYMGLPFLGLCGLLFLVINNLLDKSRIKKKKIEGFIFYFFGNLMGLMISEITSLIVYRQHIFKTLLDTLAAHSGKVEGSFAVTSFELICIRLLQYITSYSFKYNFFLMMMFLISMFFLLLNIKEVWRKKEVVFLVLIMGTHWLQTLFLDNMTQSKATITYPIILLIIGYGMTIQQNKAEENRKKFGIFYQIVLLGIAILSFIIMIIAHRGKMTPFTTPFSSTEKIAWFAICAVIGGILLVYFYWHNKKCIWLAFSITILLMIGLSFKYVYTDRSYADKQIAMDLGKVIGEVPVVGGHSKGFALYNQIDAILCDYDKYRGIGYDENYVKQKMFEYTMQYEALFYLGYASTDMEYINNELLGEECPYRYKLVKTYQRKYWLREEGDSDIAVWKKYNK